MKFDQLTIRSKRKEAAGAVELTFEIPEKLHHEYRFKPGQYITIAVQINGSFERRAYSICSDMHQKDLRILVKKIDNGLVSTYVTTELSVNEKMLIHQPNGSFNIEINNLKDGDELVLIGAGSGITPLMSIIESVLKSDLKVVCHLIYGNKSIDSIIFKEKLDRLKLVYKDDLHIHHFLSGTKRKVATNANSSLYYEGRIEEQALSDIFSIFKEPNIYGVYLCGPAALIEHSIQFLEKKNFPKTKVHREYFTVPLGEEKDIEVELESLGERYVEVSLNDQVIKLEFDDDQDILSKLIDEGHDPPYSCLQGTCSTCKAKLVSGDINMKVDIGLEADEKDQGYILTCQSVPISNYVVCKY